MLTICAGHGSARAAHQREAPTQDSPAPPIPPFFTAASASRMSSSTPPPRSNTGSSERAKRSRPPSALAESVSEFSEYVSVPHKAASVSTSNPPVSPYSGIYPRYPPTLSVMSEPVSSTATTSRAPNRVQPSRHDPFDDEDAEPIGNHTDEWLKTNNYHPLWNVVIRKLTHSVSPAGWESELLTYMHFDRCGDEEQENQNWAKSLAKAMHKDKGIRWSKSKA